MKSYFGLFHAPSVGPVDCTVLVFDKRLSIGYTDASGINRMEPWILRDITYRYEASLNQTHIRHRRAPGEIQIAGEDAFRQLRMQEEERNAPWFRSGAGREWIRNGTLVLGLLGFLVLMYLLLVPWLSEKLATRVSVKTEQRLGDAVYDAMGLSEQEDTAASRVLNDFFRAMEVPTRYDIRITVVRENVVNAFAVPGGRIVVYRALLDQIRTYPELAALLSHEFTHVNNQHATKRIFRMLGSKVFLGLLFGSFGTVSAVLVNHADNLKNLTYSRRLEKEADLDGLAILLQRGIDPRGFEDLFRHLEESAPASSLPEFMGSHPDLAKRSAYIRDAAKRADVREDVRLKTIFEELEY